jgi:serine/threonine protein kinase
MTQTIAPFVLEKSIGSGGFATVFLAHHSEVPIRVALKAISKDSVSANFASTVKSQSTAASNTRSSPNFFRFTMPTPTIISSSN